MRFFQKQASPPRVRKDYDQVEKVVDKILKDSPRGRIDPRATWRASSEAKKWNTQEQAKIAEVIRLADAYRQQKNNLSGDQDQKNNMEALIKCQLHLALFSSLPAPQPSIHLDTTDPLQQLREAYAQKINQASKDSQAEALTTEQLLTHDGVPEAIKRILRSTSDEEDTLAEVPPEKIPVPDERRDLEVNAKVNIARVFKKMRKNEQLSPEQKQKALQKALHADQLLRIKEKTQELEGAYQAALKNAEPSGAAVAVDVATNVALTVASQNDPEVKAALSKLNEFRAKVVKYQLAIHKPEADDLLALEQARACAAQAEINTMQAKLEKNDKLKELVAQSKAIDPIGYKAQMEQEKLQSEHDTKLWDAINQHVYDNEPQDPKIAQKIKTQADGSVQVSVKNLSDDQVQAAAKAALIQYQGGTPPKPITLENLSELKITDSDPPGFKTACLKALYEQLELTHGEDKKEDIKAKMKEHFSIEETDIDQVFNTATVGEKRDSKPLKEAVETLNAEHKASMDRIEALKSTATTTQESLDESAGDSPEERPGE